MYCTSRYKDAIVFACLYKGREDELTIEDTNSIFTYSLIPEKDIAKPFKVIGLDRSQISNAGALVGTRNKMAHATGKFEILTEEIFDVKTSSVLASMKNIRKCMDQPPRKWYQ